MATDAKSQRVGRRRALKDALSATTPRSLAAAVSAALQRPADADLPVPGTTKLDLVADALVAKACAGDVQAIKAVFERIDGKVSAEQSAAPPRDLIIVHTFKSKI